MRVGGLDLIGITSAAGQDDMDLIDSMIYLIIHRIVHDFDVDCLSTSIFQGANKVP